MLIAPNEISITFGAAGAFSEHGEALLPKANRTSGYAHLAHFPHMVLTQPKPWQQVAIIQQLSNTN
jgi:hypothetical protein